MAATIDAAHTLRVAAKLRAPASSAAPVACGYERSLRPCIACLSRAEGAICAEVTADGH
jgi:hypothetical protein